MPTRSIVIFGPQGCGKASQAARLQQHFGLIRLQGSHHRRDIAQAAAQAAEG